MIPIIKPKTDKTHLNSYRSISLNSCLSKILDKIIAKRLWWLVLNDKHIQNSQTGFRKGKSAMDSLLLVDYLLAKAISRKNHVSIISLDFAKTFDRNGIDPILNQLNIWKTGPKITNYTKNYITNRKILVHINSDLSSFKPIQNGIPQGSPLSVILFNQLAEKLTLHSNISQSAYADDFNLILKLRNRKNININLNPIITTILDWAVYSGAKLSTTKCKHLHVCKKHNCNCTLFTGNIHIQTETSQNILGVHFNNKYRWNTHTELLWHSLKQSIKIIKCLSSPKFNCIRLHF